MTTDVCPDCGKTRGFQARSDSLSLRLWWCQCPGHQSAMGEDEQELDSRTRAAVDVLSERRRQIEVEGLAPDLDDELSDGSIAMAGACYAAHAACQARGAEAPDGPPKDWPLEASRWKPSEPRRNLVKAAAMLLAEIERLDRAARGGMNSQT